MRTVGEPHRIIYMAAGHADMAYDVGGQRLVIRSCRLHGCGRGGWMTCQGAESKQPEWHAFAAAGCASGETR